MEEYESPTIVTYGSVEKLTEIGPPDRKYGFPGRGKGLE